MGNNTGDALHRAQLTRFSFAWKDLRVTANEQADFHLNTRRMSHRLKLQPDQNPDSAGVSAGGPRALAALLDQASRIKRGVAAGLQVEALPRTLLEDHILTTTHIVKQLSADIQALQRQMAQRDSVASGTAMAVRSLDQKNGAVIGDLRGRVARCDASIATLSADMSGAERRAVRLQQETADLRSAEDTRLKELHATNMNLMMLVIPTSLLVALTGFLAVHAAIKSLREICDIKSRLDKEKLQRDVSDVCGKPAR
ncbi:Protein FAM81B [Liparis tanakae]|uniref:Protein FAM81B n=1 Tax=Liparis tanakae TaxID=230148 RepID=A0A4Z2FP55_9TELE|nr:Protein FAM81B [Liparis tanakae]